MFLFRKRAPPTRRQEILPLPSGLTDLTGEYCLKRSSARKTLVLRVTDQGEIAVNAPLRIAQKEIDHFLLRHIDWLQARLAAAKPGGIQWHSGLLLPWLGGELTLQIQPASGKPSLRVQEEQLICAAGAHEIEALVKRWYQREARARLAERLAYFAAHAGLALPQMRLSNARTRWGSLSPQGVVSLNWRLIKARPEQLDYVVCHELAHFRQRNHSSAFWREVEHLFPDYLNVRAQLKQNGRRFFEF